MNERFEEWWSRDGRFIDPDTSDVPWFYKRKELCGFAFEAATAQSRNYTTDDPVFPQSVLFFNGRRVALKRSGQCVYLDVEGQPVQEPTTPDMGKGWRVEVSRCGEDVIAIEGEMLAGKPDITEADRQLIVGCAYQLLAFVGDGRLSFLPDDAAPVQAPAKPEGPGAARSHRFDCDECQVRGVVVDEDGCCKGCGHEARMVASPSQGVRLDDLKALVETLRTKEIDRLRSTGVNADYSESARRANAYLKALADLSDAMEALEARSNGKQGMRVRRDGPSCATRSASPSQGVRLDDLKSQICSSLEYWRDLLSRNNVQGFACDMLEDFDSLVNQVREGK